MPYDIIIGRDDADKKRFGKKGLIYFGKGYVTMGQYTSLSNPIYLDVSRSHVILVSGKRGSGKSYSLGVIAEELSQLPEEERKNIAPLIFDTMGIFWTMKYENEKEKSLLAEWKMKPKKLPVKVFVPYGKYDEYIEKGIPVDKKFSIKASELDAEDWSLIFNLDIINPISILIERILSKLQAAGNYIIKDIIQGIIYDDKTSETEKNVAVGLFEAADTWGIFAKEEKDEINISELLNPGITSIIDLSIYNSVGAFNVRALVIGLVCRKLFDERTFSRKQEEVEAVRHGIDYLSYQGKRETPLIWVFIDECLTGDTEIITHKAHTSLNEIIEKVERGEEIKVLGLNTEKMEFNHYPVKKIYKKGKRKIINLITETGREIKCTPEHRVLTRHGFASAFSVDEIATPLVSHYSEDEDCIKARILGYLYGDGWASEKTQSLGFSGKSNSDDLNKIKNDLLLLGFKSSNIFSRITSSQITNNKNKKLIVNGTSCSIQASSKAFKFFKELGVITGDKVTKESKIPIWIKMANTKVKAEFLSALMGSDGQTITKAKNAKGDFNAVRFSFNKLERLDKNAVDFATEIKELFEDLGIKISSIVRLKGNVRKNGDKTIKIIITLEKNLENTIHFLNEVGYKYCSDKEIECFKWLSYLKARLFLKKEREKIYEKAIILKKEGLGKAKIAKILGFPEAQIRDWIYSNTKPGLPKTFLDIDEWINNRFGKNVLYERVFRIEECGEEEVYDLSVDKVHNFVSNGLITHNCHEFLPREGKTSATDALVQILREGRQPGITLVLATQQPGQIHKDVMTQSDVVISHRLTAQPDLMALNEIMQSYLYQSIKKHIDDLPDLKGSAIILDDNSERIYPMRVRPKFTWHGGESPTSVKIEKKI
ncbi:DUF87 domain-containing protein [Candidatus Pacearchaeota archaeon]|nr:DUF87 domain-containing protein [Candidatus Pacearchaeota archaeon]